MLGSMFTAEDLLALLAHRVVHLTDKGVDSWGVRFLANVHEHVSRGRALSTEQARVLLRIGAACRNYLVETAAVEAWQIDGLLARPRYRQELVQSTHYPREVRHVGGNLLAFRFKLHEEVRNAIKALATRQDGQEDEPSRPWFDNDTRLWIVPVTKSNLNGVMAIIRRYDFAFDDPTLEYITLCSNSPGTASTAFVAEGRIYINVCDDEPLLGMVQHILGGRLE